MTMVAISGSAPEVGGADRVKLIAKVAGGGGDSDGDGGGGGGAGGVVEDGNGC